MDNNARLQELFAEYERRDAVFEKKKEELEAAQRKRSDAVKAIAESIAPTKRLKYKGKELLIVVRGDTWFFRSPKGEVVEVG